MTSYSNRYPIIRDGLRFKDEGEYNAYIANVRASHAHGSHNGEPVRECPDCKREWMDPSFGAQPDDTPMPVAAQPPRTDGRRVFYSLYGELLGHPETTEFRMGSESIELVQYEQQQYARENPSYHFYIRTSLSLIPDRQPTHRATRTPASEGT